LSSLNSQERPAGKVSPRLCLDIEKDKQTETNNHFHVCMWLVCFYVRTKRQIINLTFMGPTNLLFVVK